MVKNEILVKALALQGQIEGCCAKCGTKGQYLCTTMRLEQKASVFYVFYECQAEGCGGFWRVCSTDVSKEGTALVADPGVLREALVSMSKGMEWKKKYKDIAGAPGLSREKWNKWNGS